MRNDLEVLIVTMNRQDIDFAKDMNISTPAVIGNQSNKNSYSEYYIDDNNIKMITTNTVGTSINRNIALSHAKNKICLLADDDVKYLNGYENIILESFELRPEADILVFNVNENPPNRYIIREPFRINITNFMRFGAVRIAFRLDKVREKKIKFDEEVGPGTDIQFGEDTKFLYDCLKSGMKIFAIPVSILEITNKRESTWFRGYDKKYLISKAKLFKKMFKYTWVLVCLRDVIKHRKKYVKTGTIVGNFLTMLVRK